MSKGNNNLSPLGLRDDASPCIDDNTLQLKEEETDDDDDEEEEEEAEEQEDDEEDIDQKDDEDIDQKEYDDDAEMKGPSSSSDSADENGYSYSLEDLDATVIRDALNTSLSHRMVSSAECQVVGQRTEVLLIRG